MKLAISLLVFLTLLTTARAQQNCPECAKYSARFVATPRATASTSAPNTTVTATGPVIQHPALFPVLHPIQLRRQMQQTTGEAFPVAHEVVHFLTHPLGGRFRR